MFQYEAKSNVSDMWQIELTCRSLKKDSRQDGQVSRIVSVNGGGKSEVLDFENRHLCIVIASENTRLGASLVLVFDSKIGICKNGFAVPSQIVVLNKSSDSVIIDLHGQKTSLSASYLPDPLDKSGVQGICSLCHDVLESQVIQQCCDCGCKFHVECLGPSGNSTRCPSCGRNLDKIVLLEKADPQQSLRKHLSLSAQNETANRCKELSMHHSPTVILVGCGNIGSKLATQLSLIGVKRIVLIDPDRICVARNGKCCSLFATQSVEGRFKVEVLLEEIKRQTPEVQVTAMPVALRDANIAKLREFMPFLMVGAVDSRSARNELAEVAKALDCPLIDSAIAGSSDKILARVISMWPSLDSLSPLDPWADSQFSDQVHPCDLRDKNHDIHPAANPISGAIAASLCLAQIRKLFTGDSSDIGWETRIDLNNNPTIARCKMKSHIQLSEDDLEGPESDRRRGPRSAFRDGNYSFSARRERRIQKDMEALEKLDVAIPSFTFRRLERNVLVFKYVNTPGLLLHAGRVEVWLAWEAIMILPRSYPIEAPTVMLRPIGRQGMAFHPNVTPEQPHGLCYGKFIPVLLLDELAKRIQRIITLIPGAFMTVEANALNSSACQFVRLLARVKKLPLQENIRLPETSLSNSGGKI